MDIQEHPIVRFGSLKDFIQGSLGAYLDGEIRSFSAHVGLQPLYSKHQYLSRYLCSTQKSREKGSRPPFDRMDEIPDVQEEQFKAYNSAYAQDGWERSA